MVKLVTFMCILGQLKCIFFNLMKEKDPRKFIKSHYISQGMLIVRQRILKFDGSMQ